MNSPALLQGLKIRPYVQKELSRLAKAHARKRQRVVDGAGMVRTIPSAETGTEPFAGTRVYVTPLRYPGGKGKLAEFIKELLEANDLLDGEYCEPYAGGAAIAIELLLQEYVRKIHLNDVSQYVHSFWHSALYETDGFVRLIQNTPVNLDTWTTQKNILANPENHTALQVGFATFFLNRTNRSGILNGGVIGGLAQKSLWTIAARYNARDLIRRVESIAAYRNRIVLSCIDALAFLKSNLNTLGRRALIYLDPPYYVKGKDLYYDYYQKSDHDELARYVQSNLKRSSWIVSYDNVPEIRRIYRHARGFAYGLAYSAREIRSGSEVMYFSNDLYVPDMRGAMKPLIGGARPARPIGFQPRSRERALARIVGSRH